MLTFNDSNDKSELYTALSKAQSEIENATKDKSNPAFKSRYADLASVWYAIRETLGRHELAVIQRAGDIDERGRLAVETIVAHSSGQSISSTLSIPVSKFDAHGIGSAITYARRYSLMSMVGVAPDDDDGNGAAGKQQSKLTDAQLDRMRNAQDANTLDSAESWSLKNLSGSELASAIKAIEQRRRELNEGV